MNWDQIFIIYCLKFVFQVKNIRRKEKKKPKKWKKKYEYLFFFIKKILLRIKYFVLLKLKHFCIKESAWSSRNLPCFSWCFLITSPQRSSNCLTFDAATSWIWWFYWSCFNLSKPCFISCFMYFKFISKWRNMCSSNPCQNGATCVEGTGPYTCKCPTGFTGSTCSQKVSMCSSNPCQNGATCVEGINSYTCTCAKGFFGSTCSQPLSIIFFFFFFFSNSSWTTSKYYFFF